MFAVYGAALLGGDDWHDSRFGTHATRRWLAPPLVGHSYYDFSFGWGWFRDPAVVATIIADQ